MDDFLKRNDDTSTKGPSEEAKKLEFKFIKEKRASRTYIYNLEHFVKDEQELKNLVRNIKISLGTSCIKNDTEFGTGYGFNGDFAPKIKAYLLNQRIVDKDAFK